MVDPSKIDAVNGYFARRLTLLARMCWAGHLDVTVTAEDNQDARLRMISPITCRFYCTCANILNDTYN